MSGNRGSIHVILTGNMGNVYVILTSRKGRVILTDYTKANVQESVKTERALQLNAQIESASVIGILMVNRLNNVWK